VDSSCRTKPVICGFVIGLIAVVVGMAVWLIVRNTGREPAPVEEEK
jgi:hypothetical protein